MKVNLKQLQKDLKVIFYQQLEKASVSIKSFVLKTSSDAPEEKHLFLGNSAEIKKFEGEKQHRRPSDDDFIIKNETYYDSIAIAKNDLLFGRINSYEQEARAMGQAAAEFGIDLAVDVINDGESTLCYTGQNLFDTAHQVLNETAWSNLMTGTGATLDEIYADFKTTYSAIINLPDINGNKFWRGQRKVTILCPIGLFWIFKKLRDHDQVVISSTLQENEIKGMFDIEVLAGLSDANDWFMAVADHPTKKGLIHQEVGTWEAVKTGKPGKSDVISDDEYDFREFKFGVELNSGMGPGLPQALFKVKNT